MTHMQRYLDNVSKVYLSILISRVDSTNTGDMLAFATHLHPAYTSGLAFSAAWL